MAEQEKPQLILGRPQDKSLEAYKNFIQGMMRALLGSEAADNDDSMTEEELVASWKQFWERAEQSTPTE